MEKHLSGKVLLRKTEQRLYKAVALLTDVFSMLTFSPQVPVHSDFGRELFKWEAYITLSVLSTRH